MAEETKEPNNVTRILDNLVMTLMKEADATADEILSAAFCLNVRLLKGAVAMGADTAKLRLAVQVLMMQCVGKEDLVH